jgi:regulator of replication initiation timing
MENTALKLAIALGAARSAIASLFTKLQQIEGQLERATQEVREVKHQVAQLVYLSQDLDTTASQKQDDSEKKNHVHKSNKLAI